MGLIRNLLGLGEPKDLVQITGIKRSPDGTTRVYLDARRLSPAEARRVTATAIRATEDLDYWCSGTGQRFIVDPQTTLHNAHGAEHTAVPAGWEAETIHLGPAAGREGDPHHQVWDEYCHVYTPKHPASLWERIFGTGPRMTDEEIARRAAEWNALSDHSLLIP